MEHIRNIFPPKSLLIHIVYSATMIFAILGAMLARGSESVNKFLTNPGFSYVFPLTPIKSHVIP
jgi:hypothetical protein